MGMVTDALGNQCGNCKDIIMYNKICRVAVMSNQGTGLNKLVRKVCFVTEPILDLTL